MFGSGLGVTCWLLLSLPVGLWNFSRTMRSLKALAPYCGRPGVGGYNDVLCQQYIYPSIWLPSDMLPARRVQVRQLVLVLLPREWS